MTVDAILLDEMMTLEAGALVLEEEDDDDVKPAERLSGSVFALDDVATTPFQSLGSGMEWRLTKLN